MLATALATLPWPKDMNYMFRRVMLALSTLEVTYANEHALQGHSAEAARSEAFQAMFVPAGQAFSISPPLSRTHASLPKRVQVLSM